MTVLKLSPANVSGVSLLLSDGVLLVEELYVVAAVPAAGARESPGVQYFVAHPTP